MDYFEDHEDISETAVFGTYIKVVINPPNVSIIKIIINYQCEKLFVKSMTFRCISSSLLFST